MSDIAYAVQEHCPVDFNTPDYNWNQPEYNTIEKVKERAEKLHITDKISMDNLINLMRRKILNAEKFKNSEWKYCGNNFSDEGVRYYQNFFKNTCGEEMLPCICGRPLLRNCYINNGIDTLVMGVCCIEKLIKTEGFDCNYCKCCEIKIKKRGEYCKNCKYRCEVCDIILSKAQKEKNICKSCEENNIRLSKCCRLCKNHNLKNYPCNNFIIFSQNSTIDNSFCEKCQEIIDKKRCECRVRIKNKYFKCLKCFKR